MIVTIFFTSICYRSSLLTKLFNLHINYVIRLDFCALPSLVLGVRAHFLEQHLVLSSLTILCMMLFFKRATDAKVNSRLLFKFL